MANKKKPRRSAFVPRLLIPAAAIVSVVPACTLAACSSSSQTFSVAAVAYPAYEAGAPDGSDAAPDVFLGVAAVAYPAYEAGAG
jgi:hypothetical protein